MIDVRQTAGPDLRALARDLRAAGRKDLQKELFAGLNRATKPLRADAKANARAVLPQSGGLAERVARASLSTRRRGNGVRIVAKESKRGGSIDLAALDKGIVRHPTYGRAPWTTQRVRPGWFTQAMQRGAPTVRAELLAGVDDVIKKLKG